LAEYATIPGLVSHWMRRKREIDRLAIQAAADGFEQLIVIGAGLDTLAFRLAQQPVYASIISADHPATLAVVRSAVESSMPRGVELLALDLARQDGIALLTTAKTFDPARATLIVVEGVLMYLPEPSVVGAIRSLALLPPRAVRLVASSMIAEPGSAVGFQGQARLVAAWLSRRSESMYWGSTREALPDVFGGLGWSDVRVIELDSDEPGCGQGSRGLPSEVLVVAERRLAG
jgi:methyltransferase (TIGR00027 family)